METTTISTKNLKSRSPKKIDLNKIRKLSERLKPLILESQRIKEQEAKRKAISLIVQNVSIVNV